MTKVEHTKRTAEYVELLKKENPGGMRKQLGEVNSLPAIARPASLAMNVEVALDYAEPVGKSKSKRKRNRKKADKPDMEVDDIQDDKDDAAVGADDEEPAKKRQS